MNTLFEKILDYYGYPFKHESERWFKIRGLKMALELVDGGRKAALAFFSGVLACTVLVASVFSILIHENWTYQLYGNFQADWFFFTCLILGASSAVFLWMLLSEKQWLRYMKVDRKVAQLQLRHSFYRPTENRPIKEALKPNDVSLLEEMVESKLEAKMKEWLAEQRKAEQRKREEQKSA